MFRSVFLKSVRDQFRPLAWWGGGTVFLIFLVMIFYSSVRDNQTFAHLLDAYPPAIKQMIIGGNAEFSFTSPVGFLTTELFGIMLPILLLAYAVIVGAGSIAGEEEKKTLDLLLANPVSRTRTLLEKAAAMAVLMLMMGTLIWLALWLGAAVMGMDIPTLNLAAGAASVTLLALLFGTIALAVGAARGSRGLASGAAAAIAVISYFVQTLAPVVTWLSPYQKLSPFYHYIGVNPLKSGPSYGSLTILLVAAAVFVALGVLGFRRRDLAV